MAKFVYEDLSHNQFEELVVLICQKLLGISTKPFAQGKDGGRDAKFIGKADLFPSQSSPWEGIVIIQAKHTYGINKSFSDSDFNSIIDDEISKIQQLVTGKELDHYMLFANRRLTGLREAQLINHISTTCKIPRSSVILCGIEYMESLWKQFPDIPKNANLDPIESPLLVSPDELSELIEAIASELDNLKNTSPVARILLKDKNEANNMDEDYLKLLRRNYLSYTTKISQFLAAPENSKLMEKYESTAEEFNLKIIAKRKKHQTFGEILDHIWDVLFGRDEVLRRNKSLTRALVFYMYWNCDIGLEKC